MNKDQFYRKTKWIFYGSPSHGRSTDRITILIMHSHRQAFRSVLFLLINTHLFNTFQKHSADSKLSTNTYMYLMSVALLYFKSYTVCISQSYIVQHSSQSDIVYIWISKFNITITTILYSFFTYTSLRLCHTIQCDGLRSNIGIIPLRVAVPKHSPPDSADNIALILRCVNAKIAGFTRVLSTSFYTVLTGPRGSFSDNYSQYLHIWHKLR